MIVILVGSLGTGKTTYLKKKFLNKTKKNKLIFARVKQDIGGKVYTNFKDYVSDAVLLSNTTFVVDEAKTAIPRNEPDVSKNKFGVDLITWFVNSRKLNNPIFIVYHSLRDIPVWLLGYTNYFIRFTTIDQFQHQKNRFQSFDSLCERLKSPKQFSKCYKEYGKTFYYDEILIQPTYR